MEPMWAMAVDPQPQFEQLLGAVTHPAHAPEFEASADPDLDVFLHGAGARGQQHSRGG